MARYIIVVVAHYLWNIIINNVERVSCYELIFMILNSRVYFEIWIEICMEMKSGWKHLWISSVAIHSKYIQCW